QHDDQRDTGMSMRQQSHEMHFALSNPLQNTGKILPPRTHNSRFCCFWRVCWCLSCFYSTADRKEKAKQKRKGIKVNDVVAAAALRKRKSWTEKFSIKRK